MGNNMIGTHYHKLKTYFNQKDFKRFEDWCKIYDWLYPTKKCDKCKGTGMIVGKCV